MLVMCAMPRLLASVCDPEEPNLHRVFFASVTVGYVLGSNSESVVYRTLDGGKTWQCVYHTAVLLRGAYFSSPNEGWLVGDAGTIVHTTDRGQTWTEDKSGTAADLLAVAGGNPSVLVAVGSHGVALRFDSGHAQWNRLSVPTMGDLTDVGFTPSGSLLLLGRDRLFVSEDGGQNWQSRGPYRYDTLSSMAFVSDGIGFLSYRLLLQTTDGGKAVERMTLPTSLRIGRVKVANGNVYLIAAYAKTGSVVHLPGDALPSESSIWEGMDNGSRWRQLLDRKDERTDGAYLEDLFVLGDHLWAVGAKGTVVMSKDGFRTWIDAHAGQTRNGSD